MLKQSFRLSCVLSIAYLVSPFSYAANTVIDVLVAYTPSVGAAYGGDPTTRINQLFTVTNKIYQDSNIPLELHLVKAVPVSYTDDSTSEVALNALTKASDPALSKIPALRDEYKADMVILYRPLKQVHGACGIAWIGGNKTNGVFDASQKAYMYSTLAINTCPDFVTAHELGHNMGLAHSRRQDGTGGTFPYALGYGIDGKFTTVMAYETAFSDPYSQFKVLKFSSPQLTCAGVPCGIDRNNGAGADAAYTLSVTAPQIAEFYPGSATPGTKTNLDTLKEAAEAAKTAVTAATAELDANKAAVLAKTQALTQAKAALTAATATVTAAKGVFNKASAESKSAAAKAAAALKAVSAAQTKYDTAKTDATKSTALTALNTAKTKHTEALTASTQAYANFLAKQAELLQVTQILTGVNANYAAANTALRTERALTAGLTTALNTKKAAYNKAQASYVQAAKKLGLSV